MSGKSDDTSPLISLLEKELNEELQKFIDEENQHNHEFDLQLKEIAIAQGHEDGEKEDIEDKLQSLQSQLDDYEKQLYNIQQRNAQLIEENNKLNSEIEALQDSKSANVTTKISSSEENANLEYLLAETRSKLARAQQQSEDQAVARELAEKEMVHERILRLHAEKGL